VFACAVALECNPAVAKAFIAGGHEICNHGYRWEDHYAFSAEEERTRIRMALELIERITGVRPVGIFVNRGITEHTRRIIVEEGLIYDSNSYSEDVPYYVRVGNRQQLVLPYSCDTNDVRYWTMPGFVTGEHYCDYLRETLDMLLEELLRRRA
jgi:peptidoglycan/xylan/chitin deacetylase (PgdA/CDA1 family)